VELQRLRKTDQKTTVKEELCESFIEKWLGFGKFPNWCDLDYGLLPKFQIFKYPSLLRSFRP